MQSEGSLTLRLGRRLMAGTLAHALLQMEVASVGAMVHITFSEVSAAFPPFRIRNRTHYKLHFRQQVEGSFADQLAGTGRSNRPQQQGGAAWDSVRPHHSLAYAWDQPEGGTQ